MYILTLPFLKVNLSFLKIRWIWQRSDFYSQWIQFWSLWVDWLKKYSKLYETRHLEFFNGRNEKCAQLFLVRNNGHWERGKDFGILSEYIPIPFLFLSSYISCRSFVPPTFFNCQILISIWSFLTIRLSWKNFIFNNSKVVNCYTFYE